MSSSQNPRGLFTVSGLIRTFVFCISLGGLFGLVPALRARKKNPAVEAEDVDGDDEIVEEVSGMSFGPVPPFEAEVKEVDPWANRSREERRRLSLWLKDSDADYEEGEPYDELDLVDAEVGPQIRLPGALSYDELLRYRDLATEQIALAGNEFSEWVGQLDQTIPENGKGKSFARGSAEFACNSFVKAAEGKKHAQNAISAVRALQCAMGRIVNSAKIFDVEFPSVIFSTTSSDVKNAVSRCFEEMIAMAIAQQLKSFGGVEVVSEDGTTVVRSADGMVAIFPDTPVDVVQGWIANDPSEQVAAAEAPDDLPKVTWDDVVLAKKRVLDRCDQLAPREGLPLETSKVQGYLASSIKKLRQLQDSNKGTIHRGLHRFVNQLDGKTNGDPDLEAFHEEISELAETVAAAWDDMHAAAV